MIRDFMRMSLENFKNRKVRSWLTMVGIFIGITAVVAIISLGQGLQVAINEQFNELGLDKIFIQPGGGGFGGSAAVILDDDDRKEIENTQGVINTLGLVFQSATIEFKDEQEQVLVTGYTLKEGDELYKEMMGVYIEQGRLLERGDSFKAVVGFSHAQDKRIWSRGLGLGDKLVIRGFDVTVVGIQEDLGNAADNEGVQISAEAYERIFGVRVEEEYQNIVAQTAPGQDPNVIAENIEKNLRNFRNLDEGDEDFSLQTTEELADSFGSILNIVNVVIIGIAAISLVIGGIGIMNTMYTAVVERTQEIGIMKAIGAQNKDILTIFLIESGILGLVGGAIGVITGLGIAKIVEIVGIIQTGSPLIRFWWSWELIVGALLFSFLVGAISGLAPAYQASKQKPVDSLRYE